MTKATKIQRHIWHISMVVAPLLIAISQLFWKNGLLTPPAGWLQVLAFTFWIIAFQGVFDALKELTPAYSTIGFLIAVYACIGGAGFGFDGIYTFQMGIDSQVEANKQHAQMGFPALVTLFIPGILFPLSLAIMGIQLIRTKSVKTWVGITLIIAAVGFPLSRIPRIDWIAHTDNALLLIAHILIITGGISCSKK